MNHIRDINAIANDFILKKKSLESYKKILIGSPSLPCISKVIPHLKTIWKNKVVTNNGPYVRLFEKRLEKYLDVNSVVTFSSATTALISLIKCLNLKGKIITTPFSFVATSNVILLSGLEPKFFDINRKSYNLEPKKFDNNSFKSVSAIMPVHIFSRPACVESFDKIGKEAKLKIIYDGSHAFGSKYKNKSILSYGDASVVSFHATKLMSTIEGGAVVTNDVSLAKKLKKFRNFGFNSEGLAETIGLNGKLNEIQAMIGLLQLENIDYDLERRKKLAELYSCNLRNISYLSKSLELNDHQDNCSYFPVEINHKSKFNRDKILKYLEKNNIICKKYFYPIITEHPSYKKYSKKNSYRNAMDLSKKIICLPIHPDMSFENINRITSLLKSLEN